MRARRPPKRLCKLCGGDVYSWQEDALCRACKPELNSGIADLVREQRAARQEQQVHSVADASPAVELDELGFPVGF